MIFGESSSVQNRAGQQLARSSVMFDCSPSYQYGICGMKFSKIKANPNPVTLCTYRAGCPVRVDHAIFEKMGTIFSAM